VGGVRRSRTDKPKFRTNLKTVGDHRHFLSYQLQNDSRSRCACKGSGYDFYKTTDFFSSASFCGWRHCGGTGNFSSSLSDFSLADKGILGLYKEYNSLKLFAGGVVYLNHLMIHAFNHLTFSC